MLISTSWGMTLNGSEQLCCRRPPNCLKMRYDALDNMDGDAEVTLKVD